MLAQHLPSPNFHLSTKCYLLLIKMVLFSMITPAQYVYDSIIHEIVSCNLRCMNTLGHQVKT
jgi:hypothetical protein